MGNATALLLPQRPLVDYAVGWMERNRASRLGISGRAEAEEGREGDRENGDYGRFAAYIGASVVLSLAATVTGFGVARAMMVLK